MAQKHAVKYLDIKDGLSNNSVTTIYKDKNGYMWFGTGDGLNRYDGYEFKVYRNIMGDTTSLTSNNIAVVEGDARGNIWVGSAKGASVLNQAKNTFNLLRYVSKSITRPAPLLNQVRDIKSAGKGLMFVGTQKLGLIVYENGSHTGMQVPLEVNNKLRENYYVSALQPIMTKGYCWVFVRNVGLCKYTMATKKLKLVNSALSEANTIEPNGSGGIWLGTDEGLFRFTENKPFTLQNYMPTKCIVTNVVTDKNTFWIATDGLGVFTLNASMQKAVEYNNGSMPFLNSNVVWGLYNDASNGCKWFGTLRGGISMMGSVPMRFKHIKYKGNDAKSPIDNFILSFCEDDKNNIWIGTDGAGLRHWDRKSNTYTNYTDVPGSINRISSNFITSVIRDSANFIWLSTWAGGINRIDPDKNTVDHFLCYNPVTKQFEKNLWFVYKDLQNNIWASATNEGSLYIFNAKTNAFTLYDSKLTNLQCLAEARDGKLWWGDYSSVVSIDTKTRRHEFYPVGNPVRSILEDKNNNLWVGTQEGGLLLFNRDTHTFKRFTVQDGLPSNTILRLLEDKEGNIWMSTYNGLCKFSPGKKIFRNFTISDGLQSNQFSFNAGLALKSGEFLFGGINGFNIFSPTGVKDLELTNNIVITGLSINNKPFEAGDTRAETNNFNRGRNITLPYDQTTITIDFAALDYNNADKISYAYNLEGWDEHWNFVGKTRKANYTHVPEGTYTFKVKITNIYGKWVKETALLTITVLPPWYRTWWAYGLYFLCIAAVVYAYVRYNVYKERMRYEVKLAHMESKKEKELAEKQLSMFTYISHEFRTPLSLIINPLKRAIRKEGMGSAGNENDLSVAYRNSRRLLSLVDQLLLFRKAESDADALKISALNLNTLCNEVYQCFVHQAKEKNINYSFYSPSLVIDLFGDYEKIEIALFNLVSNAFKYTPDGGSIAINISETEEEACISINDTGCGIEAADMGYIFEKFRQVNGKASNGKGFGIGLYVVKYFIDKHKGTITCNSTPDVGTTFTISLLKGSEHIADVPVSKVDLTLPVLRQY